MSASKRAQWLRAAATALLVTASGLTGLAAAQPAHAAGCTLHYVANTWPVDANDRSTIFWDGDHWASTGEPTVGVGMMVNFDLTNDGAPVSPWRAAWFSQGGLRLFSAGVWNAKVVAAAVGPEESRLDLQGQSWNGNLPTGATTSFGAMAVLPGVVTADQVVTAFWLGDTGCAVINDNT